MAGRSTQAERQRLCRKRRREGVLLLKVEGKPELVSAFIARGWLPAGAAKDARVVAEALEVLADCWVRGNLSDEAMTMADSQPDRCDWCGGALKPRQDGGKPQHFCSLDHRRAFEQALRAWARRAWGSGRVTIGQLRRQDMGL